MKKNLESSPIKNRSKTLGLWDLVAHVELCLKLKELGLPNDSLFLYMKRKERFASNGDPIKCEWGIFYIHEYCDLSEEEDFKIEDYEIVPAWTSAELGNFLPESLPSEVNLDRGDLMMWNYMAPEGRKWGIEYVGSSIIAATSSKEADARAIMLLKLVELGYINFND